jgi:uncharacterized membrane protein YbhN (UPF0104 family)
MATTPHKHFEIKTYQIALPVLIGFGVVLFMFWKEFFPKPQINAFETTTEIVYNIGDTLLIEDAPAQYSTPDILAVNAKRLLRYTPTGTLLLVNKASVFKVIGHSDKKLHCIAIANVAITGGEAFGVPHRRLYAPNLFDAIAKLKLSWHSLCWVIIAFLLMFGRDLGYTARLRTLSEGKLSWLQCLRVIILWEFTSTVTPGAVGGTAVATLYIHKEGIAVGKSAAIVMTTSLLDEIYFIVMFPLLIFLTDGAIFNITSVAGKGLATMAFVGYGIKFAWVSLLAYGLFVNPRGVRWFIIKIFSLPVLRRWKCSAVKTGDDVVYSAADLKTKSWLFWAKSFGATFLSWTSRYWVVNALFVAFFMVNDHFLIFARQLIMWIMMLVSPTPGGSGFAEYVFKEFLGDFIPTASMVVILALLWRFISYYVYLILGVIIVPTWVRNKFGRAAHSKSIEGA